MLVSYRLHSFPFEEECGSKDMLDCNVVTLIVCPVIVLFCGCLPRVRLLLSFVLLHGASIIHVVYIRYLTILHAYISTKA